MLVALQHSLYAERLHALHSEGHSACSTLNISSSARQVAFYPASSTPASITHLPHRLGGEGPRTGVVVSRFLLLLAEEGPDKVPYTMCVFRFGSPPSIALEGIGIFGIRLQNRAAE